MNIIVLSHDYISPEHAASFTGLDKLCPIVKNQFPSLMRKEIRKWAEINLSYSLHKPSRRTFKPNKVYAPEIESYIQLYSRKQAIKRTKQMRVNRLNSVQKATILKNKLKLGIN